METQGIFIYICLNPTATNWQPHCRPRISHHQLLLRPGFVSQAFRVPFKSSKDKASMSEFKRFLGRSEKHILKQQLQFSSWNQICGICYGPLGFDMSSIAFRWRVLYTFKFNMWLIATCSGYPKATWPCSWGNLQHQSWRIENHHPFSRNLASHPLVKKHGWLEYPQFQWENTSSFRVRFPLLC